MLFVEEIHVLLKGILHRANTFQFHLGLVALHACLTVVVLELQIQYKSGKDALLLGAVASSWIPLWLE